MSFTVRTFATKRGCVMLIDHGLGFVLSVDPLHINEQEMSLPLADWKAEKGEPLKIFPKSGEPFTGNILNKGIHHYANITAMLMERRQSRGRMRLFFHLLGPLANHRHSLMLSMEIRHDGPGKVKPAAKRTEYRRAVFSDDLPHVRLTRRPNGITDITYIQRFDIYGDPYAVPLPPAGKQPKHTKRPVAPSMAVRMS